MQATMEYLGINQFLQIPFYVNLHTHSTYELLYYYRGEGSLHCGSSLFAYTSGSVVVIPPSVTHDEIHRTATNVAYIDVYKRQPPDGPAAARTGAAASGRRWPAWEWGCR